MTQWCVALADLSRDDLTVAGGKGANLGELIGAGFEVPEGFVVTTDAYRRAVGLGRREQAEVGAGGVPDDVAAAIEAAYRKLGEGPVAVRSSATAEDLPGAAFAGQQDTYLNVIGSASVASAVRDCWASLWTERAIAYRDRLGIDDDTVAIAVVVQRMVPADVAGVLFTADPVTGARDRVVIDASPGLGEAVVAGLVTPEHIVLDAADRVLERTTGRAEVIVRSRPDGGTEHAAGDSSVPLTEAQLRTLAATGRRIATHFGRPQDIEWAIADDRVWIVQARPMTALPPPPISLNPVQRIIGPVILELLPRRPYPLELTAWVHTVGQHVRDLVAGLVGGHVDLHDVVIAEDWVMTQYVPPNPHPTRRTPARLLQTLLSLRPAGDWRQDARYTEFLDGIAELNRMDVATADWRRLVAVPETVARLSLPMTGLRISHLPPAAAAMVRLRLLLALLRRSELFPALLLESPTETSRANDELAAMAAAIRDSPLAGRFASAEPAAALAMLRQEPAAVAVAGRLDAFLQRYGHRETGSILLVREPSWAADPAVVVGLLQVLLPEPAAPATSPFASALRRLHAHPLVRATRSERRVSRLVTQASSGVATREDTHFELSRLMPPVRAVLLELGRRLAAAGMLDDADDVWYLSWPELRATDDPEASRPDATEPDGRLRAAVARRRSAMQELAGSPLIATAVLYPRRDDGDALVTGVGGGGGRATGRVRVIDGPAHFAELQTGEVLVCPATNPSWTPLFTRAAAVVVDHGGLASHAAIVAREYGIPAVMGSGDGTRVLRTGLLVEVDGDRGRVRAVD